MKITKQTPTTLIIEHNLSLLSDFISGTIVIGIFIILPSLAILSYELKTLECKRVEPTQVGCNLTSVDWLGLGTKRGTFIPAVQGAKAITTTQTIEEVDEDGDEYQRTYYYHQLVLVTSGDKTVSNISTSTAQDATAARINSFIKDQSQKTLTVQLTNIFDNNGILFFLSPSVGLLCLVIFWVSCLRSKEPFMWVFDKKSGNLHVTFKNVIGQSETKRYRLQDIQSAKVIRKESTDSDGDTTISYETQLDMRSGEPIHLSSSNDRKIAEAINRFLGKPDTQSDVGLDEKTVDLAFLETNLAALEAGLTLPENQPNSEHGQEFYRTEAGVSYKKYDKSILPLEKQQALSKIESDLIQMGFVFLGSFTISRFAGIVIHAYSHPTKPIEAAVLGSTNMKTIVELESKFKMGASLTTSQRPGLWDIPSAKMYRNSYPSVGLSTLLNHHIQRLNKLRVRYGAPKPASQNLKEFALGIEEFLQRQPSSLWFTMRTFLTQLAIVLFKNKSISGY